MSMSAHKDNERNTWTAAFYYEDWTGERRKKQKRGFKTKREAQEWERSFLDRKAETLDMAFSDFVELYSEDMKPKLRWNTWLTKEHIIIEDPSLLV